MGKKFKSLEEVPKWIKYLYEHGEYYFNPPPVCTAYWTDLSWINYIYWDKEKFKILIRRS